MQEVKDQVIDSPAVDASIRVNPEDKARLTVNDVALKTIAELYRSNFKFYKRVNDDERVKDLVLGWVFDEVIKAKGMAP